MSEYEIDILILYGVLILIKSIQFNILFQIIAPIPNS